MTTSNLVIVADRIETAGVVTWWRLAGGINLADLRAAWGEHGLDTGHLPEPPTPATALRRAVHAQRGPGLIVQPMRDSGGWALVRTWEENGEPQFAPLMVATLDAAARCSVRELPGADSATAEMGTKVRAAYYVALDELVTADVSPWLCKMMDRVGAVALRDTGGIYFVPPPHLALFDRIVGALRLATKHVVACVPALRSEEAEAAVFEAVAQEVARHIAAVRAELDDEKLGERALRTRASSTDAALGKLLAYEGVLGGRLEQVRGGLIELRARVSEAILLADIAADKEAV